MRYQSSAAFRTALEHRIKNWSNESGLPIVRLRKLAAFDRLLARLTLADPDRWILKGAVALDLRFTSDTRPTMDLDLLWNHHEREVATSLESVEEVDPGDYFEVAFERTKKLDNVGEFSAVRYRSHVSLANRPFEVVTIDVGFDDDVIGAPESLTGSDLLAFAGIDPISVWVLPLPQHVAEKVHAYSRIYLQSRPSSRVKDLIDLVIMSSRARFEAT